MAVPIVLPCASLILIFVCICSGVPDDWNDKINTANMLYSPQEPTDLSMMPSVGNGYLATVISSDTIYVSGVFNGLNTRDPSHRAAISATNSWKIQDSITTDCAIDLETATYFRRGTVGAGTFEQRWYAHRQYPSILIHEVHINNTQNEQTLSIKFNARTMVSPDFKITTFSNNSYVLYNAQTIIPEEPSGSTIGISVVTTPQPTSLNIPAKEFSVFYYITTIRSSLDTDNTEKAALNDYLFAESNINTLYDSHVEAWTEIWTSRIQVFGDFRLSQVINASLYYILNSVRHDWPYSLSPGSLSSNGYNGHVFWDCETWMYPPILLLQSDIAASLIEYRLNRMNGAALKAKSYNRNYKGLMFPWESAFTGQEVCPDSAPTGQLEQHISGDIVFAIRQYWYLTNDLIWLKLVYPLVEGVAQFWASRVTYNGAIQKIEINGVIPPDEYAVNVNNSVYTNVVAGISLEFAVTCAKLLNISYPSNWITISTNLKIPMDDVNNIHLEFDGYKGQLIKQADVILLGYPLMYPMTSQVRENDLTYYQQRTDSQGPAMTYAMETVAWLELGKAEQADDVWSRAWANAHDPFMVWTETPTGGAVNFITGAGGFLQAVLNGYGGIRIKENELSFNPQLPSKVTSIKFTKIIYLKNEIEVSFDKESFDVTLKNIPDVQLEVVTSNGESFPLLPNSNITLPISQFSIVKTKK